MSKIAVFCILVLAGPGGFWYLGRSRRLRRRGRLVDLFTKKNVCSVGRWKGDYGPVYGMCALSLPSAGHVDVQNVR